MEDTTDNKRALMAIAKKKGCFARVEFIALLPEIQALRNKGLTMSSIYEELYAAGKITMKFKTFNDHARTRMSLSGKKRQSRPASTPASHAPLLPAIAKEQTGSSASTPAISKPHAPLQANPTSENKYTSDTDLDTIDPDLAGKLKDRDKWQ